MVSGTCACVAADTATMANASAFTNRCMILPSIAKSFPHSIVSKLSGASCEKLLAVRPDPAVGRDVPVERRLAGMPSSAHMVLGFATLVAFAIEMEVALSDAAILIVEKVLGPMFRRADRTRSKRLIDQARLFRDPAPLHVRLGRTLIVRNSHASDLHELLLEHTSSHSLEAAMAWKRTSISS
jgi:hypothetical protein